MITHKKDNQHGILPLCWYGEDRNETFITHPQIDVIDCVLCLRMLVKDAVVFGNGRRARRS